MKQTLPPGTAKPPDSMLVEASLVFHQTSGAVDLRDYSQWWSWVKDASWKHPEGLNSSIKGKENYPVVHLKILKPSIQKGQRKATTRWICTLLKEVYVVGVFCAMILIAAATELHAE